MILRAEDLVSKLNIPLDRIDVVGQKLTVYKIYMYRSVGILNVDSKHLPRYEEVDHVNNLYVLRPGAYLVRYAETVEIPDDCIALAIPRSTLLRMGVILHTAVWDPGYRGQGVGILVVFNQNGVIIEKGAQIAQLVYVRLTDKTKHLYNGSYQGEQDK